MMAWIAPIAQSSTSCSATRGCRTSSWPSGSTSRRRPACAASAPWSAPASSAGYQAIIDPAAVGRAFEIEVMIELTHKDRATVEAFERRIAGMEPVIECRRMFGIPDYLVRVAVADTAAYEAFYMNELAELPGIGRVSSQFTMKLVKSAGRS
jgi:hypothetical protein